MKDIKIKDCVDGKLWDAYVEMHNLSAFCHLYGWRKVIEGIGHKSYYLIAEENEKTKGILPLFVIKSKLFGSSLISMPFMDYGGIISDNDKIANRFLEEAQKIGQIENVDFLQLHHSYPNKFPLESNLDKVNLKLKLSSEKELMKGFKSEIKNRINKAYKSCLHFEVRGAKEVKLFYEVFAIAMRDMGTPVMPLKFFENMLLESNLDTEIFLIKKQKKVIGGAIAIYFKDQMELPWIACMQKYFSLCPNNLLYWEAMKRGLEKSMKDFNFGRSSKDSGHYIFKKRWGASVQQLFYQYISYNGKTYDLNPNNPKYKLAVNLWKKLPLSVANYLGPHIARNIP